MECFFGIPPRTYNIIAQVHVKKKFLRIFTLVYMTLQQLTFPDNNGINLREGVSKSFFSIV
jgi:hypothetical protein